MQEPLRGSGVLINIGMICKRDPGPFIWDHVEFVIKAVSILRTLIPLSQQQTLTLGFTIFPYCSHVAWDKFFNFSGSAKSKIKQRAGKISAVGKMLAEQSSSR